MTIASLLHPRPYAQAFLEAANLLGRHRRLLLAMVRRELLLRHAGQFFGSAWVIGHPLLLMLIFLFVFGVVFKTRLGDTYQMPRDYTVYILSGLVPWLSILPTLTNACNSITGNAGLVKQFVFHIEILPAKDVLTTSVTWLVGTVVVSTYTLVRYETLPWTYVLLPIVAVLHIISMVGIAFLLSATTVFMRDLKDFVIIFGNAGIYLLPVVYLPEWVPDALRPMLYVNPFSYPIWVYQDVTYFGRIEHPIAWIVNGILSVAVFAFGFRVFRKLRPFFGSAL